MLFLAACSTGERVDPATEPASEAPAGQPGQIVQRTAPDSAAPAQLTNPSQSPGDSTTTPGDAAATLAPLSDLPALELIQPADLTYLGAFRLPDGAERPLTFEYGGNAMTFRPGTAGEGLPGSLFISGHDRMPYGDLPDGSQVAEVSIPIPSTSRDLNSLPQAVFIQGFHDVAAGYFSEMEEIVRMGMQYLESQPGEPKIHLAWGQHFEPEPPTGTHAWFNPDLSNPDLQGTWFIGEQSFYAVNDYLLDIPVDWAEAFAGGRTLATGRFRDGGWSGMGPALFAYRLWLEDGSPAPSGTHLQAVTLLSYESSADNENFERCLDGYQHPDDWAGGAWLGTADGRSALLLAGTKSNGEKFWYGFANPAGVEFPCVEGELVGQFPICRLADGSLCPPQDLVECDGHGSFRGWWSTSFTAQFILYDPNDLARVALGELESWQPQPYAVMDIDQHLFFNPPEWEVAMLGEGDQRRFRIGDVAYDRENGIVYVLELFAEGAKPVVHVWQVQ
jgi:hypothetical protein